MTAKKTKKNDLKKATRHTYEKSKGIYETLYIVIIVLTFLMFLIEFFLDLVGWNQTANQGVRLLKFSTLIAILARPFTNLVLKGTASSVFLFDTFPALKDSLGANPAFQAIFTGPPNFPAILFVLPFIFFIFATFYLGYRIPGEKSAGGQAVKFAFKIYLGKTIPFGIFWGLVGWNLGFWPWPYIIAATLLAMGTGILDLFLMIIIGGVMASLGRLSSEKPETEVPGVIAVPTQVPTKILLQAAQKASIIGEPQGSLATSAPTVPSPTPTTPKKRERNYCAFCGSKIELGARYCAGCGVYVEEGVPVETTSAFLHSGEFEEPLPYYAPVASQAVSLPTWQTRWQQKWDEASRKFKAHWAEFVAKAKAKWEVFKARVKEKYAILRGKVRKVFGLEPQDPVVPSLPNKEQVMPSISRESQIEREN